MTSSLSRSKTRITLLAQAICILSTSAHAAVFAATPDCDAASGLQCRLNNILTLLYGVSVVLGVLLIIVIVVAIRSYFRLRKNRKLLP